MQTRTVISHMNLIRALPILVFADIADTDIADICLADKSTDFADTDIFWSKYLSRYLHT